MKKIISLIVAAACLAVLAVESMRNAGGSVLSAPPGYRFDPAWPKQPAGIEWGDVPGVAVDAKDQVWIFTRNRPTVQVYSPDGTLVRKWHPFQYGSAHYLKIDPDGNIWLTDVLLHIVRKFSPEGELLLTLGTAGAPDEDEAHFNKPTDMIVTPAGDVFVTDGYGNNRVVHFDKEGKYVNAWGKKGTGPGEFDIPHGIAVDSKGLLYVADRTNARVQVFTQKGKFLRQWQGILVPWGLWVTPKDEIWTCGSSVPEKDDKGVYKTIPPPDQVVVKLDTAGKELLRWNLPQGTKEKSKRGQTVWIHAAAVDSKGNLYVGDIFGHRVQKLTPAR